MAARPTTTTTTGSTTEHVGGGGPETANPDYWDAPLHWVGGHVQARGVLVPVPASSLGAAERGASWHDGAIVKTGTSVPRRAGCQP